ncbi:MAG: sporulation transcriptional regulator SpoIIID [Clostridium sp.]|nr:sporulation transcriptional regulator SpoIIID [Clostridium sp.]
MYRKSYILRKKKRSSNVQIATALHKDVTDRLEHINPSLAAQARVVLDINKAERHIRGGMATREKYQHRLAICSKKEE